MLERFLNNINTQGWDFKRERVLITVSGGIDSIVLVDLMQQCQFEFGIAHCNFQLRDKDSERDMHFVKALADLHKVEFYCKRFDTLVFAEQNKVSTQMAARTLRYNWFEEIALTNNFQWIATAHHATDQLETVLLNLTRGTGLAGLKGMRAENNRVVRPLLPFTRVDIEQYAKEKGLEWREDVSNASSYYKRNNLRHHVLPILREINPSVESTVLEVTERLSAADELVQATLKNWASESVEEQIDGTLCLNIAELLRKGQTALRLHYLLDAKGFLYKQCQQIAEVLQNNPLTGKTFFSSTHKVLINREKLIVMSIDVEESTTLSVSWEKYKYSPDFVFPTSRWKAAFDMKYIEQGISTRVWQLGDWFCPFGMKGKKKKVSDLLIDAKVSRFEKDSTYVLVNSKGEIMWVVGYRTDERFKVTKHTTEIAIISVHK